MTYSRPKNMYFILDFLYWQAKETGLTPYVESHFSHPGYTRPGQYDFRWDPGFRIGIGQCIDHDKWDLSLVLSHLHTKAHSSATAEGDQCIFPSWSAITTPSKGTVDSATARWRLHFALVDAILGRDYSPSRDLILKPHIGVRYACVRQKIKIIYAGGSCFPGEEDRISTKNKFHGIGPSVGIDTTWIFTGTWSVFGNTSLSLLTGDFYVHENERTSQTRLLGFHNTLPAITEMVDLRIGVRKELFFDTCDVHVAFDVGWEELFFFGQNQLWLPLGTSKTAAFLSNLGDLTLQGLTLRAKVDF